MEDLPEEARRALDGVVKGRTSPSLAEGVRKGQHCNSDVSSSLSDVSRIMGRRTEEWHGRDDGLRRRDV